MKYLIINGSPRKKNTWNIAMQAKANLDGEFEEVHLIKEKILPCNGCNSCFEGGESTCPHFESVNPIVDKISQCDGLIITSPVYALNVSGLLKNLFDHTAYLYHRPAFFNKKALVVVSTAGAGQKKVAKYIDETLRHWGFNKNYKIAMALGGRENLDAKEIKQINKTSQEFRKDVESEKLHGPKFMDLIFYNAWRALARADDANPKDKEYWQSNDLIDHEFAPIIKLNPIKKICGKLFFFMFRRMF